MARKNKNIRRCPTYHPKTERQCRRNEGHKADHKWSALRKRCPDCDWSGQPGGVSQGRCTLTEGHKEPHNWENATDDEALAQAAAEAITAAQHLLDNRGKDEYYTSEYGLADTVANLFFAHAKGPTPNIQITCSECHEIVDATVIPDPNGNFEIRDIKYMCKCSKKR